MLKDIQLLLTGGTIDSEWDPTQDTAVPFTHSNVKPYIEKFIKPEFEIYEKVITMLDSREIDDSVRETLVKAIRTSKSENIIIPHGTYTMAQTGRYIVDKLEKDAEIGGGGTSPQKEGKRIILVGSFYPLVGFSQTDAAYNLGFAIGALEFVPPGVYIAMNSRLFAPKDVDKNLIKGKFYSRV